MRRKIPAGLLTEAGKKMLQDILEATDKPRQVVECMKCGKVFKTLTEEDLEALDEALPGQADFSDVDYLCVPCTKQEAADTE